MKYNLFQMRAASRRLPSFQVKYAVENESERETAYLLSIENMKRFLHVAKARRDPQVIARMPLNALEFDGAAFDDLSWWFEHDRRISL